VRGALNANGNVRPHEAEYIEVKQDVQRTNRLTQRTRSAPDGGGYGGAGDAEYHDRYPSESVRPFFCCVYAFFASFPLPKAQSPLYPVLNSPGTHAGRLDVRTTVMHFADTDTAWTTVHLG
jgi:hypothetical protein